MLLLSLVLACAGKSPELADAEAASSEEVATAGPAAPPQHRPVPQGESWRPYCEDVVTPLESLESPTPAGFVAPLQLLEQPLALPGGGELRLSQPANPRWVVEQKAKPPAGVRVLAIQVFCDTAGHLELDAQAQLSRPADGLALELPLVLESRDGSSLEFVHQAEQLAGTLPPLERPCAPDSWLLRGELSAGGHSGLLEASGRCEGDEQTWRDLLLEW